MQESQDTRAAQGVRVLDLRIHTNGVTLVERFCELLGAFGIGVGVLLDGDKAANDVHRRYRACCSSHDKVLKAIDLLNRPLNVTSSRASCARSTSATTRRPSTTHPQSGPREEAGLTERKVAEAMQWSPSKLIRMEAGTMSVTVTVFSKPACSRPSRVVGWSS
ncbi:helix-turn-helix domain-containing protein [Streptomyces olivochromogenes]|uniref:helix-turn-helix domain-containing protein n=1 Tax=Streptomyces olivochromogenes TaxID=1963 RepID=UPI001F3CEABB|nr:helix-turn-helix transcriptional regulator [Streptomyces olivochromogenes]MCF3137449.1 hypothetical protein [Streptomyces olivochromogenes]